MCPLGEPGEKDIILQILILTTITSGSLSFSMSNGINIIKYLVSTHKLTPTTPLPRPSHPQLQTVRLIG